MIVEWLKRDETKASGPGDTGHTDSDAQNFKQLFGFSLITYIKKGQKQWAVVAHTFDPRTWETEADDFCEFEASLLYRANSRGGSKATEKQNRKEKDQKQPAFCRRWQEY